MRNLDNEYRWRTDDGVWMRERRRFFLFVVVTADKQGYLRFVHT